MNIELIIAEIAFAYDSDAVHHNIYANCCRIWDHITHLGYSEKDILHFEILDAEIHMEDGNVFAL